MTPEPDAVERALAVFAHPDDVDFSAAGTIAMWTDAGIKVTYCLATRGDAGGFDDTPREEMPLLREREQRAAAAVLGVHDVTFLGYSDGTVTSSLDLRRDIAREIRRVRPQRVLTSSPERDWERIGRNHPDHLAVGEATLCAVYPDARNPFAFPELLADEGLEAWTVSEVWLSSARANRYVDITDRLDRKFAALREHVSQTAHNPDLESWLSSHLAATAERGGLPEGRYAESFQVVDTA